VAHVLDEPAHGTQYIVTFGASRDGDESIGADVDALKWSVHTVARCGNQRWSVTGVRGVGNTGSWICDWVGDGMAATATVEDGSESSIQTSRGGYAVAEIKYIM